MDNKNVLEEIRLLINSPGICTDSVFDLLYKHKCLYLLSRVINNSERCSGYLATNQMIQKFRYNNCQGIFDRLNNSMPYAVIKGAVLSNSIYGKPFYRLSGDIDILVSRENANKIAEILAENGFQQGKVVNEKITPTSRKDILYHRLYTHQMASFQRKTDFLLSPFVAVDVNFDVTWGEEKKKINVNDFLAHTESTAVYNVNMRKLSPIYEFISMCMHHYKDMNSIYLLYRNGFRLYEFFDIYYYLINRSIDPLSLKEVGIQFGVAQYVYYCIYYTYKLFPDNRLKVYLNTLFSSKGKELLNCFGLSEEERRVWEIPFLDRVFSNDFKEQFLKHLTNKDLRKIEVNTEYMTSAAII